MTRLAAATGTTATTKHSAGMHGQRCGDEERQIIGGGDVCHEQVPDSVFERGVLDRQESPPKIGHLRCDRVARGVVPHNVYASWVPGGAMCS